MIVASRTQSCHVPQLEVCPFARATPYCFDERAGQFASAVYRAVHIDRVNPIRYFACPMALPAATHLPTRRWTRNDYERLVELGVFQPHEHLELIRRSPAGQRAAGKAP